MRILTTLCLVFWGLTASAQSIEPRDGWMVMESDKPFDMLLEDTKVAVRANGMVVVTQAGPTGAAASRGITIPDNRVIGVFNNIFAVKILNLSTAAMIEAPIRIYLTEDEQGNASLSYKTPSLVFAPYAAEGGVALADAATALDAIFLAIAEAAR